MKHVYSEDCKLQTNKKMTPHLIYTESLDQRLLLLASSYVVTNNYQELNILS